MPPNKAAKTLRVDLGARSYDIHIGAGHLASLGKHIRAFAPTGRLAVITDETVRELYGAAIEEALSDYKVHMIIRPPGEAFVQVPTTLLSQVDSSVGGKTAVNNSFGKNLIGAFYQPRAVITDTDLLSSLPVRELKAGYAEILKYGLLGDAAFFTELEAGLGADILALNPTALSRAIYISCETKAKIVAQDEREGGVRALLNLGHTFGHALELEGRSGQRRHGNGLSFCRRARALREIRCGPRQLASGRNRYAAHF